jgi:hypothetical protein
MATRTTPNDWSAPVGIRTPDLRFRRPTLYPAELRALGCQRVAAPRYEPPLRVTAISSSAVPLAPSGSVTVTLKPLVSPKRQRVEAEREGFEPSMEC